MAKITKKTIRTWDGGIKTSIRDSNPDTSDGAQLIRHFDIYSDPNRLIPMPSWTSFANTAEKAYGIRALGGLSDTVYGVGSALSNWYSANWSYRVEVTTALGTGAKMFDLTQMPSTFWDNVEDDGSDIRVVDSAGALKGCDVRNFDKDGETGQIWTNASGTFYVYYGYADALANTGIITNASVPFINNAEKAYENLAWMFHLDEDTVNAANNDTELSEGTDGIYTTGDLGQGLTGSTVLGDSDDALGAVAKMGKDPFITFRIYVAGTPLSNTNIITHSGSGFTIALDTSNHIDAAFDGAGGTTTQTGTTPLTTGWHTVMAHFFDGDTYIYIDGVLSDTGNFDDGDYSPSDGAVQFTTLVNNAQVILDTVCADNLDANGATIAADWHDMLTDNANQYTVGSQTALSSFGKSYDGVGVYTKSISSGDWEEYFQNGQPVKDLDAYPVNGFVEASSDLYFITSQNVNDGGFLFLSKTTPIALDVLDAEHLLLGVLSASNKIRPLSDSPVDKAIYFTFGSSALGAVGDPGTTNEFSAYSTVMSMTPWRNYLAIGSSRRTRANVEIWNLSASTPDEFIDAGTGNLRVVGNASDTLFAVVDNYIDDAVLSSNSPTMEIKEYVGNGRMESVISLDIPSTYTGWTDDWERAVSFFKLRRNDETLFYAKLPADSTATTFNEGFWAVGKNTRGQLALSLMIDTSELGVPENVHGFAQQVFFIQKDGGIQRLATDGTYDKTSLFKSLIMNEGNSEIEKKLVGIELVTEPLEAGQTISVYYKKVGESRVKIGDFTGTNEIAFEKTTLDDDTNMPHYQEIEFQIESTGGASAILEFSYRFEYLSDIV